MTVKPKKDKSLALKNFWLRACSSFLSNMFTSLVYSFVYLTKHLTNIRTKLYTFCILPVQNQNKSQKSPQSLVFTKVSTKPCSNVIVLLCTAETERVQSLIRALARTNFKSI